jgi:hypothetical protein
LYTNPNPNPNTLAALDKNKTAAISVVNQNNNANVDNIDINDKKALRKAKKNKKRDASYKFNDQIADLALDTMPMIGFSFGVDRLLPYVQLPLDNKNYKIWISTIGKFTDATKVKLELVGMMIEKGYNVYYNLSNRKFTKEIANASENGCSYIIIVGDSEWSEKKVSIKNMNTQVQETILFTEVDIFFNR